MQTTYKFLFFLSVCFFLSFFFSATPAQSEQRAITIAVPEGTQVLFNTILQRFYTDNPDVYVALELVSQDSFASLDNSLLLTEPEKYYQTLDFLMNRADVHIIYPNMMGLEATRAGYLLDLQPLISSDSSMNPDDYYPAVWQAYQWDNGFWAVPSLAAPLLFIYQPEAFDAVGLSYPTDAWTIDEIANAARILATPNQAGLHVSDMDFAAFLTILSEQNLNNSQPDFASPEMVQVLTVWQELVRENTAINQYSPDIPMLFSRIQELGNSDFQGILLNGKASLDVVGFAVSRGSQNPELAYHLAKYLSTAPEIRNFYPSALPANRSLAGQFPENYQETLLETAQLLRDTAIDKAISPSSLLFSHYVPFAANNPSDALVALQDAQTLAESNLSDAEARFETTRVSVPLATVPTPSAPNGVVVDFALMGYQVGFAERSLWEDAIEAFLANNPDIDEINLTYIDPVQGYWDRIPEHECIANYDFQHFDNSEILPLDPLLQVDPDFDDDLIGDISQSLQRDGVTYALPYSLSPMMMTYNRALFEKAGLPEPDGTWTVNEFVDTLQQLETVTDGPPLRPYYSEVSFWEMLMISYGATPIDYSTEPPTLHLADEANVPIIQQVLDLAKTDLISYERLSRFFGTATPPDYKPALVSNNLWLLDDFAPQIQGLVSFPRGTDSMPVSFWLSYSFIFADAQYPEACYRWLREINRHPELYYGMPSYHSLLDTSITQAIYGESGVRSFQNIAAMMEDPKRVFIPSDSIGTGTSMFISRAYDRYVLEDADLASELQKAVEFTEAHWHCMEETGDLIGCLLEADPTIRENLDSRLVAGYD